MLAKLNIFWLIFLQLRRSVYWFCKNCLCPIEASCHSRSCANAWPSLSVNISRSWHQNTWIITQLQTVMKTPRRPGLLSLECGHCLEPSLMSSDLIEWHLTINIIFWSIYDEWMTQTIINICERKRECKMGILKWDLSIRLFRRI